MGWLKTGHVVTFTMTVSYFASEEFSWSNTHHMEPSQLTSGIFSLLLIVVKKRQQGGHLWSFDQYQTPIYYLSLVRTVR